MTIQLNLQGSTGVTVTEATDFHVAASSISGHRELCQGAHQASLRSLAQPPATGGVQHRLPDVSQWKLVYSAVIEQSCSSRCHPTCPCSAFGAGSSGQASAFSALAGAVHVFMPVAVCWSRQLPVYIFHIHIYIYKCVCGFVCMRLSGLKYEMKWNLNELPKIQSTNNSSKVFRLYSLI